MAKILYGVQGDAGGHVARALSIARQMSGHEIIFVGGGRVASLRHDGYDTVDVPMLASIDRNNHLDLTATLLAGLRTVTDRSKVFDRLDHLIRDFDPDLILTDYEYFLPRAARRAGRPCISVDRQHFLTHCNYPAPAGGLWGRALTLAAIHAFQMECDRYFIVSFTPATVKNPTQAEVFAPIIRQEILNTVASDGDDAIVYLQAATPDWLRQCLGGSHRRFIIYGLDREGEDGNLTFRRHDYDRFAHDLAGCAYVISHAGNNLISEALHLGKPLLAFPVTLKYEQFLNAHLLAGAGYGMMGDMRHGAASLASFESSLDVMGCKLAHYRPWSERSVAGRLVDLLQGASG